MRPIFELKIYYGVKVAAEIVLSYFIETALKLNINCASSNSLPLD